MVKVFNNDLDIHELYKTIDKVIDKELFNIYTFLYNKGY
eukprot:CAMPEP_0116899648 /NCGR_PEP_ID=MMETSP0467-20121206/8155_1 /TAXON_ID=283647 /ORGANISM="Mesodinium pulex, Strain SPMC105" /LENGTH=38 /DNA_ID= /DNA_START= /DNA_END= /DNA_ORIENTATION=